MQILCKALVASTDVQVFSGDCYLVGASLHHTGTTDLYVYNENTSTSTAAKRVIALKGTCESIMFPLPGIKCEGIYADNGTGTGHVYYYI